MDKIKNNELKIVIRPKKWFIFINLLILFLAIGHIFIGFGLTKETTGVNLDELDKYAFSIVGFLWLIFAVVVFNFKITVIADGLIVKNFWPTSRVVTWKEIQKLDFPIDKNWPRIELKDDEYIPIMAIQRLDTKKSEDDFIKIVNIFNKNK